MYSFRPPFRCARLVVALCAFAAFPAHALKYTVRAVDTFARAADRLGVSVKRLHQANPAVTELVPGHHLRVPGSDESASKSASRRHRAKLLAQLAQWKAYKKLLVRAHKNQSGRKQLAHLHRLHVMQAKAAAHHGSGGHRAQLLAKHQAEWNRHLARLARRQAEGKRHLARLAHRHALQVAHAHPHQGGHSVQVADRAAPRGSGRLLRTALACRGVRYIYGGTGQGGFDCSGFTRFVYRRALGVDLPHSSHEQYHYGHHVSRRGLQSGDLLFFHTDRPGISHVGIYLGNGRFVHAANPHRGVTVDALSSSYYHRRLVGASRIARG